MFTKFYLLVASCCLLGAVSWTTPATAEETGPVLQAAPVSPSQNPFSGEALDEHTLATLSGGTEVFNDMELKGIVSDNHASHLSTGNNAITDGSFAGASGLPMVIQNTGNNVLIQNATIVNVQIQ